MKARPVTALLTTLVLLASAGIEVLPSSAAEDPTLDYTLTDVGTPWPGVAYGFNDRGEVVGYQGDYSKQKNRAFSWQRGIVTDLQEQVTKVDAGTFESIAYGVNGRGEVVGFACLGGGRDYCQGISWRNGEFIDNIASGGTAIAVNDNGQVLVVVGPSGPGPAGMRSLIWKDNTSTALVGIGNFTVGKRINNNGQVIGSVQSGGPYNGQPLVKYDAFWPDPNTIVKLEPPTGYSSVSLIALNDLSQVVGSATAPDGTSHAILWQGSRPTDLGVFTPQDIDNAGDVLGSTVAGPILWHDGTIFPLSSLLRGKPGWEIASVLGMTLQGRIMGIGKHGGQDRAFILTPMHDEAQQDGQDQVD